MKKIIPKNSNFTNTLLSDMNLITSARLHYNELKTINQFRSKFLKKITNKSKKFNLIELNPNINNKKSFSANINFHKLPKIKSFDSIFQSQSQKTNGNMYLKFLKNIPNINIENINSQSIAKNNIKNYIFYRTVNSASNFNSSKFITTNTSSFNLNNNKSLKKNFSLNKLTENIIFHSNSNSNLISHISSANNSITKTTKSIKNKNNSKFYYNIYNNYYKKNVVENLFNKPFEKEILQEFVVKLRYIRGMKYSKIERENAFKIFQESTKNKIILIKKNHKKLLNAVKSSEDYRAHLKLYLEFLKKQIEKESIKIVNLKDQKYSLINDNYTIRHKIKKLQITFQNYLCDKYFLLSVKNHSTDFNTFKKEDQKGYLDDIYKLEIFDIVLNKIYEGADDEILISSDLNDLNANNSNNKNLEINNIIDDKISQLKKDIRSNKNEKMSSNSSPKKRERKHFYIPRFICKEILDTPEEFNHDLNLISNNIKHCLQTYNEIQNQIINDRKILKDMEKNEIENKDIFKFERKLNDITTQLNNLKKNNRLLENKINYLKNSSIIKKENLDEINLKNKLSAKLNKLINDVVKRDDKLLFDYLFGENYEVINFESKIKNMSCIDILFIIEKGILFLEKYCNQKKIEETEKYTEVIKNIDFIKNCKLSKKKMKESIIQQKLKIQKAIEKTRKLFYIPNKNNYTVKRKFYKSNKKLDDVNEFIESSSSKSNFNNYH